MLTHHAVGKHAQEGFRNQSMCVVRDAFFCFPGFHQKKRKSNTPIHPKIQKGITVLEESTVSTGRHDHISMYDEFLRITRDQIPYTETFITSFLASRCHGNFAITTTTTRAKR